MCNPFVIITKDEPIELDTGQSERFTKADQQLGFNPIVEARIALDVGDLDTDFSEDIDNSDIKSDCVAD